MLLSINYMVIKNSKLNYLKVIVRDERKHMRKEEEKKRMHIYAFTDLSYIFLT